VAAADKEVTLGENLFILNGSQWIGGFALVRGITLLFYGHVRIRQSLTYFLLNIDF